jgi:predicted RNase H-like HicB family nuclease
VFNCLQYELSDGAHAVMSADAKGIHASGASAEEAIEDFSQAIKTRLADKLGGLHPGTSHFEFQELNFRDMERGWMNDGVQIIQKRQISIRASFGESKHKCSNPYCDTNDSFLFYVYLYVIDKLQI